jgi:hypothetical protein
MSEFPTTDHAEALNQKFRERSRNKRLGKKEESVSANSPAAEQQEVLTAETKAANAAAKASAAAEKRAYAALHKHVGSKSMADEERVELIRLTKKIRWYKKKFEERLAALKLKDKYSKLADAQLDYEAIREHFDEVDPEPILTGLYQNGAMWLETNAKRTGYDLSGYADAVKACTTVGSPVYDMANVGTMMKEMSCELAEWCTAGIWTRFISANIIVMRNIDAANRMKRTKISERLAREIRQ